MRTSLLLIMLLALSGCAGKAFDTTRVAPKVTPAQVIANPEPHLNKIVLWGGIILGTLNQEESTQIEVLAYPLNSSQRPSLDEQPQGRFIISHDGYLEPVTYAQGRRLSVIGKISTTKPGKVGDSDYVYPVIAAEQMELWSQNGRSTAPRTTFHLGIGIRL